MTVDALKAEIGHLSEQPRRELLGWLEGGKVEASKTGLVLSPSERAAGYRAWAEGRPRNTPVLSDQAISRETIYSTRG